MLRSSLWDYADAYILFKNCANCISKINNTQIDNAEYIDMLTPM